MIKKIVSGIIILFIALYIPIIVVLSGSGTVSKKIAEAETTLDKAQQVAKAVAKPVTSTVGTVGSLIGGLFKTNGVTSVFAEGKENIQHIQDILAKGTKGMWLSIILTLFLVLLLAILNWNKFLNNLGLSLLLGGIASLITGGLIFYFFIVHFDTTFKQIYEMAAEQMGSWFGLPIVTSFVKSFAHDFIVEIANQLAGRSAVVGGISIIAGFILRMLQRLVVRR